MGAPAEEMYRTRRRRGDRGVFGLVLVFLGAVWLLGRMNLLHLAADTLLAILLMCLGAGLLLTRRSGRHHWPILLGGIVLFVLMGSSAAANSHIHGAVGDQSYEPTALNQLRPYNLEVGDMTINLTKLDLSSGPAVQASVGSGDMEVIVPRGARIQVNYTDRFGDVTILGNDVASGFISQSTWTSPGAGAANPPVVLNLTVDEGDINVRQAGGS
ncbi:MAG TPA: LiaF domain-containing protein [Acidimicrobiales bacterium]|nr:LiaF domain-containing protein [Acidimicrobiales bacterium]